MRAVRAPVRRCQQALPSIQQPAIQPAGILGSEQVHHVLRVLGQPRVAVPRPELVPVQLVLVPVHLVAGLVVQQVHGHAAQRMRDIIRHAAARVADELQHAHGRVLQRQVRQAVLLMLAISVLLQAALLLLPGPSRTWLQGARGLLLLLLATACLLLLHLLATLLAGRSGARGCGGLNACSTAAAHAAMAGRCCWCGWCLGAGQRRMVAGIGCSGAGGRGLEQGRGQGGQARAPLQACPQPRLQGQHCVCCGAQDRSEAVLLVRLPRHHFHSASTNTLQQMHLILEPF